MSNRVPVEKLHPNTPEWIHEIVKLGGFMHGFSALHALEVNGGDPFFCSRCGDPSTHPWAYKVAGVVYRALLCTTCLLVMEREKKAVFEIDEELTKLVIEKRFDGNVAEADAYAAREFGAQGREVMFHRDAGLKASPEGRQLIKDALMLRGFDVAAMEEILTGLKA